MDNEELTNVGRNLKLEIQSKKSSVLGKEKLKPNRVVIGSAIKRRHGKYGGECGTTHTKT